LGRRLKIFSSWRIMICDAIDITIRRTGAGRQETYGKIRIFAVRLLWLTEV